MKRRINFIQKVILLLFISALSGCFGGGTIGTGLTSFGGSKNKSLIRFTLEGTVENRAGYPIGDAEVTITTSSGIISRRTSPLGIFRAPLALSSGEFIGITIIQGALQYNEEQQLSPAGADTVRQTFILE